VEQCRRKYEQLAFAPEEVPQARASLTAPTCDVPSRALSILDMRPTAQQMPVTWGSQVGALTPKIAPVAAALPAACEDLIDWDSFFEDSEEAPVDPKASKSEPLAATALGPKAPRDDIFPPAFIDDVLRECLAAPVLTEPQLLPEKQAAESLTECSTAMGDDDWFWSEFGQL